MYRYVANIKITEPSKYNYRYIKKKIEGLNQEQFGFNAFGLKEKMHQSKFFKLKNILTK